MDKLKNRIDEMSTFVANANYYEILGVTVDASSEQITRAFRALAKDWHVDRFSSVDLGDHKRKLQIVFATINKAHQALSNPNQREEYNAELSGDNNEAAASIGAILEANALFKQGKNMMRSGAYSGAFEKFKASLEKQPHDPQYRAYALYCEYLLAPKNKEGRTINTVRANEIFSQLDEISQNELKEQDWLFVFMGNVAAGLGRKRTAASMYGEALMVNPKNHEAKRQLRLTKMRRNSSSKGFFSKLFSKK